VNFNFMEKICIYGNRGWTVNFDFVLAPLRLLLLLLLLLVRVTCA
tara:strand:- start:319 stop:453 length:135 start_codon:yes stop_codon:yes gene_type:complete